MNNIESCFANLPYLMESLAGFVVTDLDLLIAILALCYAFYSSRKSSKELKTETEKVRRLVNILARYLDNSGALKAEFDKNGDVADFIQINRAKTTTDSHHIVLSASKSD